MEHRVERGAGHAHPGQCLNQERSPTTAVPQDAKGQQRRRHPALDDHEHDEQQRAGGREVDGAGFQPPALGTRKPVDECAETGRDGDRSEQVESEHAVHPGLTQHRRRDGDGDDGDRHVDE